MDQRTARAFPPLPSRSRRSSGLLFKAAAACVRAQATGQTIDKVVRGLYGRDDTSELILRAASSPATLTDPAWAGPLARNLVASELIQKITALSAAASLMQAALKVDLTGKGSITVPGRTYNPQSAGGWIGEGQPIPLREPPILGGPKLMPRKLAVVTSFTEEMARADSIEAFVTAAVREAAAALLDLQLLSTAADDGVHPPGILAGATTVTASTATAAWAISTDIGNLVDALARAGGGLEPVIIAAPSQAASLRMWRQENFYDIYASVALARGTIVAVESSSFVSGLDGIPEFSTSTGTTLHYEDTAPKDIVGGTGTVAYPTKSLFQTDIIALKMILRASWGMRNAAHVAIMTGTSW
jgi:hypothetical protein